MSSDNIVIRVLIVASQWSTHKIGRNLTQQPFVSDNLQITVLQAAVQALSRPVDLGMFCIPIPEREGFEFGASGSEPVNVWNPDFPTTAP